MDINQIKAIQDQGLILEDLRTNEVYIYKFKGNLRMYLACEQNKAKIHIQSKIKEFKVDGGYKLLNIDYLKRLKIHTYD